MIEGHPTFPIAVTTFEGVNKPSGAFSEVTSFSVLQDLMSSKAWSHIIFNKNRRASNAFVSTRLLVLDVDDNCTLSEAQSIFAGYCHLIGTTKSHQKDKNGKTCDRFRIVLFLDSEVSDSVTYKGLYAYAQTLFPFIDGLTTDLARLWFPCTNIVSHKETGNLFKVPKPASQLLPPNTLPSYSIKNSVKSQAQIPPKKFIRTEIDKVFSSRKIDTKKVAEKLANNLTRLINCNYRLQQKWLATELGVSRQAANNLIKKLVTHGILAQSTKKYCPGVKGKSYGLGPKLMSLKSFSVSVPWQPGKAHNTMLRQIRYCHKQGMSKRETLAYCKHWQGIRPPDKMRKDSEILGAIDNWWKKSGSLDKVL